ncbi:hypothetical protein BSL78_13623 [Apostichopus japonicus]|uniref:Uncharacterized protein n=1 Tax=Stichopus japonicus TaxID=307972 RepID=A0A2G8KNK2_STIJA|nr:hypothetical protein BSL78_13623 [Apostichopus japonicus]
MAAVYFLLNLSLLFISATFISTSAEGVTPTVLADLRNFNIDGLAGRFKVPRFLLENELQKRVSEGDNPCKDDVHMELLETITPPDPSQGELDVLFSTITDLTLDNELTSELKDRIAVEYSYIVFSLPFISASKRGTLALAIFTNSTRDVLLPYNTNTQIIERVDQIEMTDNGDLYMSKGDDVMVLNIQYANELCDKAAQQTLKQDINELAGKKNYVTDFPMPFDNWVVQIVRRCHYCKVFRDYQCQLQRAGSDVCTQESMLFSKRAPCHDTDQRTDIPRRSSLPTSDIAPDQFRRG